MYQNKEYQILTEARSVRKIFTFYFHWDLHIYTFTKQNRKKHKEKWYVYMFKGYKW